MKTYLNNDEKLDTLRLITFHVNVDNMVQKWEKISRNKEIVKYLKTIRTLMDKVNRMITEPLDPKEKKKIVEFAGKLDTVTIYTAEAKQKYKEMLEMDTKTPIDINELYDFYEVTAEYCRLLCKDNPEQCKVRDFLIKWDFPVARYKVEDNECPYKL